MREYKVGELDRFMRRLGEVGQIDHATFSRVSKIGKPSILIIGMFIGFVFALLFMAAFDLLRLPVIG